MADPDIRELNQKTTSQRALSKPGRRARGNRIPSLLLLLGIVILAGGGGVLAWQFLSHQGNGGTSATTSNKAKPAQGNSCTLRLPWNTIQQEVANGLHLTVEQVKAKVHSGRKIQEIAASQGISETQLHSFELHAYQNGNEQWKRQGCLTQQDFNSNKQRYSSMTPMQLNDDFTEQFSA